MNQPPPGYETVLKTRERQECLESQLVLDAVGIAAEVVYHDDSWLLLVGSSDLAVSQEELDAYRRENPPRPNRPIAVTATYGGAGTAVFVYACVIILVAILDAQSAFGLVWSPTGSMQAGRVVSGEWWRTVTALTLHADVGHLGSNLVFGAVFGFLAGRVLGGGVAWLAIVVAGALGNFINAMVQAPTHSSIGASTAVFAALGVIVSHALRPRGAVPENRLKRWSPLIGGAVLLAFTGIGGERTDVVAHLTGFLAGMLIGWLGCRLPGPWLESSRVQWCAGIAAVAFVSSAWVVGLVVAG